MLYRYEACELFRVCQQRPLLHIYDALDFRYVQRPSCVWGQSPLVLDSFSPEASECIIILRSLLLLTQYTDVCDYIHDIPPCPDL